HVYALWTSLQWGAYFAQHVFALWSVCPQGLTEKLWIGLENFVFHWLINADRCSFYCPRIYYRVQYYHHKIQLNLWFGLHQPLPFILADVSFVTGTDSDDARVEERVDSLKCCTLRIRDS
ncbi:hypothetical protein Tco_0275748, partial [Tanacetum coccineum]